MIREGKGKEKGKRRNRKTRGLTGLTVNSCFFYLPLAYLIIFKYIYTYFYMCGRWSMHFWGVNCYPVNPAWLMREKWGTGDEG